MIREARISKHKDGPSTHPAERTEASGRTLYLIDLLP